MRLSRDEVVTRGRRAQNKHSHPWYYEAFLKSGRGRTRKVRLMAYNRIDLTGQITEEHAIDSQTLSIFNISKVLRYQLRSRREDV